MSGWFGKRKRRHREIEPDEIFLDSSNKAGFDADHFEGRIEKPLARKTFFGLGVFFVFLLSVYLVQAANLDLRQGTSFAERAKDNQLEQDVLFATRGEITDRTGTVLASDTTASGDAPSDRIYAPYRGITFAVGYAKSPTKDTSGNYTDTATQGVTGAEAAYDSVLAGQNGATLEEKNALGQVVSESQINEPKNGQSIKLSIDAGASQALYDSIANVAQQSKFQSGAGVIMDLRTGEILAMVSYPEYSLQTMADGTNTPEIQSMLNDPHLPFLDRAVDGLFAPGSIVKPFLAVGALDENIIDENTQILSTGSISIPNPYDPTHPSVFLDWRANGWVDMRHAIAYSSDVYFYEVGGGYGDQKGLGISGIDKYLKMFGFGTPTGLYGFTESAGNVPSPAWKAQAFPDDPTWRLGDTYHSAIGQYGTLVTPLQAVRAVAALGNGGSLLTPMLLASSTPQSTPIPVAEHDMEVAREGMRLDVTDGIAQGTNVPFVDVAAKTGTAQVGVHNQWENSWIVGFYPYNNPEYAFAVVEEKAPTGVIVGTPAVMRNFLDWIHTNEPQYLQ